MSLSLKTLWLVTATFWPLPGTTVEGGAQLFTQTKLEAVRDAGVNRISLGVQQLDPALLEASGRRQMRRTSSGCALRTNVGLIFG